METKSKKRLNLVTQKKHKKEISVSDIKQRLKALFKTHVGDQNSISPYEIFEYVFKKSPESVDIFERNFLWNILKRIMTAMRTTNECFIVHSGIFRFFVLQSNEELKHFEKITDNHIRTLRLHKANARIWVEKKMWTGL